MSVVAHGACADAQTISRHVTRALCRFTEVGTAAAAAVSHGVRAHFEF